MVIGSINVMTVSKHFSYRDKKVGNKKAFENFSCGIVTSRDAWAYNSSREALAKNMRSMIIFYNSEVERFNDTYAHAERKSRVKIVNDFVNSDVKKN